MKPTNSASTFPAAAPATAELLRRIDQMSMGAHDRARAKAALLRAEYIAEGIALIVTAMKSLAARLASASTRRSTLRNSPSPR